MGLDTVEFVIETEERFNILIDDEDAQHLGTVGELAHYVVEKTSESENTYSYEQVLKIVIDMLVNNYGVPEGKATYRSHFVDDLGLD